MEKPNIGDTRIKSGFLFLPMSIYKHGYGTVRWLTFAEWEETYTACDTGNYWRTTHFFS